MSKEYTWLQLYAIASEATETYKRLGSSFEDQAQIWERILVSLETFMPCDDGIFSSKVVSVNSECLKIKVVFQSLYHKTTHFVTVRARLDGSLCPKVTSIGRQPGEEHEKALDVIYVAFSFLFAKKLRIDENCCVREVYDGYCVREVF